MARRAGRVNPKIDAFWDASALVPLCIRQPNSAKLSALYLKLSVTVWWGTSVEIASAIARVHRMGIINSGELAGAGSIATILEQSWLEVSPTTAVRLEAGKLIGKYELRAADAFQLSAAIAWCEGNPAGRIFLTADDRLREAARLYGFDVSKL